MCNRPPSRSRRRPPVLQPPAVTQPPTTTCSRRRAGMCSRQRPRMCNRPPSRSRRPPMRSRRRAMMLQPPPGTYVQPPPRPVAAAGQCGFGRPAGLVFPDFGLFGDRYQGAMGRHAARHQEPLIDLPLVPTGQGGDRPVHVRSAGINSEARPDRLDPSSTSRISTLWQRRCSWAGSTLNRVSSRGQRFRVGPCRARKSSNMVTFTEPYLRARFAGQREPGFYTRFYNEWDEQRIGGRAALRI